jgi:hypothetical protein
MDCCWVCLLDRRCFIEVVLENIIKKSVRIPVVDESLLRLIDAIVENLPIRGNFVCSMDESHDGSVLVSLGDSLLELRKIPLLVGFWWTDIIK